MELQQGFVEELRGNNNQERTIITTTKHPRAFFTQEQYQQILQLLSKTDDGKVVEKFATIAFAYAGHYFHICFM